VVLPVLPEGSRPSLRASLARSDRLVVDDSEIEKMAGEVVANVEREEGGEEQ